MHILVKGTRSHAVHCNYLCNTQLRLLQRLMLPSIGLFLQLFVSHLVRMVFVTEQAPVSASLGGLAADAEQVSMQAYTNSRSAHGWGILECN